MRLIDQHTKGIMEGCKERAREAGLQFGNETLEYIVTNRDLLKLSPKIMIPTLYDYWVHEIEVLKEQGRYELYPSNPYETVINTRPPMSFYNNDNPDWLNVMIFYHVLGHIDFFMNNLFFEHTWDYDFAGRALSDKRTIAGLRAEKGRWVDYVIEFARGIDNLVGYYDELMYHTDGALTSSNSRRLDFYFDIFLQTHLKVGTSKYLKELERYNRCTSDNSKEEGERLFFIDVEQKHPHFRTLFEKHIEDDSLFAHRPDLLQFLLENSPFLDEDDNVWMKSVIEIVRSTSIFFQPQIRTKIMNEGWASYWHETLFMQDDRINGHEVEFARVNSGVTSMPRVGLNPYALGMQLFRFIEESANEGRYTVEFDRLHDIEMRKEFDAHTKQGREFIFQVRKKYSDFTFIHDFLNQDFIDQHELFVAGERINWEKMVKEFFVKSRRAEDYRAMIFESLYHPPCIEIDMNKSTDCLYLVHRFEEKPLVEEFIRNTMMGIEYLWGGPVELETSEVASIEAIPEEEIDPETREEMIVEWKRVLYTMDERELSKINL